MTGDLTRCGAVTAKVRAMIGMRLTREDYAKMAAMKSVSEVADFLREHPGWGKALESVDTSSLRRERLEEILRKHCLSTTMRLFHYLRREDKTILRYPVLSAEMEQIMRFMRLAAAGRAAEYEFDLPAFFNRQSHIQYELLTGAETYDDMLAAVKGAGFYTALKRIRPVNGEFPSYLLVETQMRRYYFRSLAEMLRGRHGEDGALLREATGIQADWINITAIERILRYYRSLQPEFLQYLLPAGAHLRPAEVKAMIALEDADALRPLLKKTYYGRYMEGRDGISLENLGQWILLSFFRRHMTFPSVFIPIAFINLYQNELRNLIHTIECVRYGLAPEVSERYLILL